MRASDSQIEYIHDSLKRTDVRPHAYANIVNENTENIRFILFHLRLYKYIPTFIIKKKEKAKTSEGDKVWSCSRNHFHPIRYFYVLHFMAASASVSCTQIKSRTSPTHTHAHPDILRSQKSVSRYCVVRTSYIVVRIPINSMRTFAKAIFGDQKTQKNRSAQIKTNKNVFQKQNDGLTCVPLMCSVWYAQRTWPPQVTIPFSVLQWNFIEIIIITAHNNQFRVRAFSLNIWDLLTILMMIYDFMDVCKWAFCLVSNPSQPSPKWITEINYLIDAIHCRSVQKQKQKLHKHAYENGINRKHHKY